MTHSSRICLAGSASCGSERWPPRSACDGTRSGSRVGRPWTRRTCDTAPVSTRSRASSEADAASNSRSWTRTSRCSSPYRTRLDARLRFSGGVLETSGLHLAAHVQIGGWNGDLARIAARDRLLGLLLDPETTGFPPESVLDVDLEWL